MSEMSTRTKFLMLIALFYGFMGICCGTPTLFFGQTNLSQGFDPEFGNGFSVLAAQQSVLLEQPVMRAWTYLTALLDVGLGFAHFACFAGYILRKEWAKKTHLFLAMIKVVEALMDAVIYATYFMPAFAARMGQSSNEVPNIVERLIDSLSGTSCLLILPVFVILMIFTESNADEEKNPQASPPPPDHLGPRTSVIQPPPFLHSKRPQQSFGTTPPPLVLTSNDTSLIDDVSEYEAFRRPPETTGDKPIEAIEKTDPMSYLETQEATESVEQTEPLPNPDPSHVPLDPDLSRFQSPTEMKSENVSPPSESSSTLSDSNDSAIDKSASDVNRIDD